MRLCFSPYMFTAFFASRKSGTAALRMVPKDLSELTSGEMREFLNSFDTVLCDCDGVIWNLSRPIARAKESLEKLRKCGKDVHFISNNSAFGTSGYLRLLKKFDPDITDDDLIVPSHAIIAYLKRVRFDKEIFILGTKFMKDDFQNAGLCLANTEYEKTVDTYEAIRELVEDNISIGAVICDYDIHLSNIKLSRSIAFLRRPDVLLITGATDRKIHIDSEIVLPGPHFYQSSLVEITGRTPLAFGKPSKNLQKYVATKYATRNPSRVLFVGDSIEQDIQFGSSCGYQTLLVFTGVSTMEEMKNSKSDNLVPNYYINSLGDLCDVIEKKLDL
ncbi:hypothetical protein PPYR_07881 [Photinus pyralis]|uniref:4-nitrophenylphosphatase n=3 Tax=Photinus pyralis TaxID=7054 RepID=A0A5N4ARP8_PHOPY|nr:4-nitrophenylphosphatase-like [Photinus pyralis]KAB0800001.1 hypothetical protein PPYR_07881 [Photinus pyralis]